ncbi:glyoxalase I [Dacryopinax primogenitus]|uniref:lactoylglutathione lyase n=1 Tax=Dacryopinax primogenitus (strain DJM 731) TaxID=1858805 RepID=M5G6Z6_DACPD|nr:glyoxalase I [Dacryopinax primogenitus]EJU04484.1 glyoxalase I [Dacryopinax primogenitus]
MPASSETAGYRFNHTMIRIKDPKASLHFYCDVLGMEQIDTMQGSDFTLYFLAYDTSKGADSAEDKAKYRSSREGLLELTHNHGTESDPNFKGYASGNAEPGRGFGHTCISTPNVEEACARLERLGVPFQKKLTDGRMKNIAFALDPDGYWVEIIGYQERP